MKKLLIYSSGLLFFTGVTAMNPDDNTERVISEEELPHATVVSSNTLLSTDEDVTENTLSSSSSLAQSGSVSMLQALPTAPNNTMSANEKKLFSLYQTLHNTVETLMRELSEPIPEPQPALNFEDEADDILLQPPVDPAPFFPQISFSDSDTENLFDPVFTSSETPFLSHFSTTADSLSPQYSPILEPSFSTLSMESLDESQTQILQEIKRKIDNIPSEIQEKMTEKRCRELIIELTDIQEILEKRYRNISLSSLTHELHHLRLPKVAEIEEDVRNRLSNVQQQRIIADQQLLAAHNLLDSIKIQSGIFLAQRDPLWYSLHSTTSAIKTFSEKLPILEHIKSVALSIMSNSESFDVRQETFFVKAVNEGNFEKIFRDIDDIKNFLVEAIRDINALKSSLNEAFYHFIEGPRKITSDRKKSILVNNLIANREQISANEVVRRATLAVGVKSGQSLLPSVSQQFVPPTPANSVSHEYPTKESMFRLLAGPNVFLNSPFLPHTPQNISLLPFSSSLNSHGNIAPLPITQLQSLSQPPARMILQTKAAEKPVFVFRTGTVPQTAPQQWQIQMNPQKSQITNGQVNLVTSCPSPLNSKQLNEKSVFTFATPAHSASSSTSPSEKQTTKTSNLPKITAYQSSSQKSVSSAFSPSLPSPSQVKSETEAEERMMSNLVKTPMLQNILFFVDKSENIQAIKDTIENILNHQKCISETVSLYQQKIMQQKKRIFPQLMKIDQIEQAVAKIDSMQHDDFQKMFHFAKKILKAGHSQLNISAEVMLQLTDDHKKYSTDTELWLTNFNSKWSELIPLITSTYSSFIDNIDEFAVNGYLYILKPTETSVLINSTVELLKKLKNRLQFKPTNIALYNEMAGAGFSELVNDDMLSNDLQIIPPSENAAQFDKISYEIWHYTTGLFYLVDQLWQKLQIYQAELMYEKVRDGQHISIGDPERYSDILLGRSCALTQLCKIHNRLADIYKKYPVAKKEDAQKSCISAMQYNNEIVAEMNMHFLHSQQIILTLNTVDISSKQSSIADVDSTAKDCCFTPLPSLSSSSGFLFPSQHSAFKNERITAFFLSPFGLEKKIFQKASGKLLIELHKLDHAAIFAPDNFDPNAPSMTLERKLQIARQRSQDKTVEKVKETTIYFKR